MKIRARVKGVTACMSHRFVGNTGDGKGATKQSNVPEPMVEAKAALYVDDEGRPYIPAAWFEACMVKAATQFKLKGKKTRKDQFRSGIAVEPLKILHENPKWELDVRMVNLRGSHISRARPIFPEWSVSFDIVVLDPLISPEVIKDILIDAGKYVGVGDYRPKFGRFSVEYFEVVDAAA